MKKYSQLQLNVLRFYRAYLQFARSKPEPLRSDLRAQARALMEKHRGIPRTNFRYIEFVLRTEQNKLQTLIQSNISNISTKDYRKNE